MNRLRLIICCVFLSVSAIAQTPKLVLWFDFNNLTGTSVPDLSGSNNNGFVTGTYNSVTGSSAVPNAAINLNGAGNFITVNPDPSLNLTRWTIRTMIRPTSFQPNSWIRVVEHGYDDQNSYYTLELSDFTNNTATKAKFFGLAPGQTTLSSEYHNTTDLIAGQWYCLTLSYDGDSVKTFLNGFPFNFVKWPNIGGTNVANPSLIIGSALAATGHDFKGDIGDIQIYNDALTSNQIATINCGVKLAAVENLRNGTIKNGVKLEQNSPNPVKGQTTIEFYIPGAVKSATIKLYSLEGKHIETRVISSRGAGKFDFNAGHLAQGVYYYSLFAEGQWVDTKKMVIIQ